MQEVDDTFNYYVKDPINRALQAIPGVPIYFPPLADITGIVLISSYSAWSYAVYSNRFDIEIPSVAVPFSVLTGALGFILPLQMSAAITKNKECLFNFNAFCGNIMALAWELLTLVRPEDLDKLTQSEKSNKEKINKLFMCLKILPPIVKHTFRSGKPDLTKLTFTKHGKNYLLNTSLGQEINQMTTNGKLKTSDYVFIKIYDLIAEMDTTQTHKNMLIRTTERVYGSYGNMGNLDAYAPPRMFEYFLDTALFLYVVTLPFSFDIEKLGVNIVWQGILVIYFFLGISLIGKRASNAFENQTGAFQTVGASETAINKALHVIEDKSDDVQSQGFKIFDKRTFNAFTFA